MANPTYLSKVQGIVIFSLALAILLTQLFSIPWLRIAILFGCIGLILLLFPSLNKSTRIICLIMLTTGHSLFWFYDLHFPVWIEAFSLNLGLISLFAFVPMFIIPIAQGGYLISIEQALKKYQSNRRLFFSLFSTLTFLIGSVINLAVIHILHAIFKQSNITKDKLASAMLIGFNTTNIWSPYFASVAIVLHFIKIPYSTLGPFLLVLALLHFTIGNTIVLVMMRKSKTETTIEQVTLPQDQGNHRRKVIQLILIVSLIFSCLFIVEKLSGFKMTFLVSAAGLIVSLFWLSLLKGAKSIRLQLLRYIFNSLPRIGNEVSLFLCAGFFGIVIMNTPIGQGISIFVIWVSEKVPLLILIALIILCPVLLALIGLHQIITVTILATTITPELLGLSQISFGVLLAAAWCHSSSSSPFSPINITIGSVLNKSSFEVGLKGNYPFILASMFISILFIFIIR